METFGSVFNLFRRTPEEWNVALLLTKKIPLSEADIGRKIAERHAARQSKDWARADAVRNELEAQGILLEDKREGTAWKVKIA
jgi:cysteinyl-tRNA synthetase